MKVTLNPDNTTAEETFLWYIIRTWREVASIVPEGIYQTVNWPQFIELTTRNKLQILVADFLRTHDLLSLLPDTESKKLMEAEALNESKATTLTRVLQDYYALAGEADVPTIPLKGLWVSERIYHNPSARPGHDLDLITVPADTNACIQLCEKIGFDRFWPGLLPDDYYKRHHLHLELSLPDCWTWVEIHWAFDHPRTLLTIDYEGMFARAKRADLLGATIWEPNWVDVLSSLSIHLVKHATYLPAVLDHPKLERILAADGELMHCLDIAEILKQYGNEIDWPLLVEVSKQAGSQSILHAAFSVAQTLFDAPLPEGLLDSLNASKPANWQNNVGVAVAEHILAEVENRPQSRLWSLLLEPNWVLVFRPIRLLDYVTYLFPTNDFLHRKYGKANVQNRLRQTGHALADYAYLGWDTVRSTLQVRRTPLTPDVELPAHSKCLECA